MKRVAGVSFGVIAATMQGWQPYDFSYWMSRNCGSLKFLDPLELSGYAIGQIYRHDFITFKYEWWNSDCCAVCIPHTVSYTTTDSCLPPPFPPCVPVRPLWAPSWWVLQRWLLQYRCLLLLPQPHDLTSAPLLTVNPTIMFYCYQNSSNLENELYFCYGWNLFVFINVKEFVRT